jgi:hypothetical protein
VDEATDRRFCSRALATDVGVVGMTNPRSAMLEVVTIRTSPSTIRAETRPPSMRTRSVTFGLAVSVASTNVTVR